jgi:hypothetical protein
MAVQVELHGDLAALFIRHALNSGQGVLPFTGVSRRILRRGRRAGKRCLFTESDHCQPALRLVRRIEM